MPGRRAIPAYLWAKSRRESPELKERNVIKTHAVKASEIERRWLLVDADGKTLGRLATEVATLLSGKHKAMFSRHLDTGDFVVIVNAEKVNLTGKKLSQKRYYRHSGYPGGFRSEVLRDVLEEHPNRVLEHAVRGMLPRNKLGDAMFRKLKVYGGPEHPHAAQQPEVWTGFRDEEAKETEA
jgi:large subunit ribosomal protein L13